VKKISICLSDIIIIYYRSDMKVKDNCASRIGLRGKSNFAVHLFYSTAMIAQ
jgi:hypothetical protein